MAAKEVHAASQAKDQVDSGRRLGQKAGTLGTIGTQNQLYTYHRGHKIRSSAARIARKYAHVLISLLPPLVRAKYSKETLPGTKRTAAKCHWALDGARSAQITCKFHSPLH